MEEMNKEYEPKRVASPAEVVLMLVMVTISFSCIIVIRYFGSMIMNRINESTEDRICRVVDMYTETGYRTSKKFTVFEDDNGGRYELFSTKKDYIGRECELSVSGEKAYRKSFEPLIPNMLDIICIIEVPLAIVTIPVFLYKTKKQKE